MTKTNARLLTSEQMSFDHDKSGRGRRSPVAPEVNLSELARRIGFCRTHLSRIVNGHSGPGLDLLKELARVRGGTVEEAEKWLKGISSH